MTGLKWTSIAVLLIASVAMHIVPTNGASNILGIFTNYSPSHLIVHMSLAKTLAERGHNVTVVVSQPPTVNHESIHVILIPPSEEQKKMLTSEVTNKSKRKNYIYKEIKTFFASLKLFADVQAEIMKDARFTELYDNVDNHFDLIICGYFLNSFQLGVVGKFKAPLIVSWLSFPNMFTDRFVGNPTGSSYVPSWQMDIKMGAKMSMLQRMQTVVVDAVIRGMMRIVDMRMNYFYRALFPSDDDSFPSLEDMYRNVSLVFCNSHFSEGPIRAHVPAVIEIGGIQAKEKPDPLPEDIAPFLDSANATGAILFSLGSNLKGSVIKPEIATYIFNVLSKLKQKVIWKWEDLENTPGKSANILYKKWMPQDDILAHPNLKLFITHAGKGGVAEAQYHGVPMLALPVYGDQRGNALKLVTAGYGQHLELIAVTEEKLKEVLDEVLNNPTYAANVKKFSRLYRDRPLTARESVVYWSEYVIRHHGAAHMQSPLVHMNFIESSNLDVYAALLLATYILYRIFRLAFVFVCRKLCKKNKAAEAKKVKKQ